MTHADIGNAVRLTRQQLIGMKRLIEVCREDPTNLEFVLHQAQEFATSDDSIRSAYEWLITEPDPNKSVKSNNRQEYLRGLREGFVIRTYRLELVYPDGKTIRIREGEDLAALKSDTEHLFKTYAQREYELVQNEDKTTGVWQKGRTKHHCNIRLAVIRDNTRSDPKNHLQPNRELQTTDYYIAPRKS